MSSEFLKTALSSEKTELAQRFEKALRLVPDFPVRGVLFRDLMPVLQNPLLCNDILDWMAAVVEPFKPTAIAGIESRGFFFGFALAQKLCLPFVPLRKEGKLPAATYRASYRLEYGEAALEIHQDALQSSDRVVIHDDLLATGGTLSAAAELVRQCGAKPVLALVLTHLGLQQRRYIERKMDIPVISLYKCYEN